jgi:prepilin-type N-terminal cleavage/methylation domain-containing protein
MRRQRKAVRTDDGFTIVELLISLALLGTVMAAMGPFFVGSVKAVSHQRASQVAVQLADGAVEQVRALRGSSLLAGRGQTASTAQWDAAPAVVTAYQPTMKLAWDSKVAATAGADAAVPTGTQVLTVEGNTYRRTVYVGKCDIYLTPGSTGTCVNPDTSTAPTDNTKDLLFFRVVVLVQWSNTDCGSTATSNLGTCEFVASTLIARGAEPSFSVHRAPPTVKTSTLTIYLGQPAAAQVEAQGGELPNTFAATGMPPGTTLSAAGYVTGTPTTLGTYTAKVTATDQSDRDSPTKDVIIKVVAAFTLAGPANPQKHHVGDTVNLTFTAASGTAPYAYSATGLPPGLSLDAATGALTGIPTTAGPYAVSAKATDNNGGSAVYAYTHTIYPAVALAVIADQTITLGSAFNATVVGSGGGAALTYSATGLPLGVLLNAATGAISGLPTISGRYLPKITVSDGLGGTGGTATRMFSLTVTWSGLLFTSPSLTAPDQTSQLGKQTSLTLDTNGNLLGLVPTTTVAGLPPGLSFNSNSGKISGKPTTAGVYTVTVQAVNLLPPQTTNLTFLWTVT